MAVTAYAAKGDEERIRDAGAEGYVSKPISVLKFVEAVRGPARGGGGAGGGGAGARAGGSAEAKRKPRGRIAGARNGRKRPHPKARPLLTRKSRIGQPG